MMSEAMTRVGSSNLSGTLVSSCFQSTGKYAQEETLKHFFRAGPIGGKSESHESGSQSGWGRPKLTPTKRSNLNVWGCPISPVSSPGLEW
jgi:hypothetical protein